jgi:polyhydroxyalkanoate synthesis repressor PhaR
MRPPDPHAVPRHLRIRKYPNRRYYDTTRSRHLTLEEIRDLIRDGWEVSVTDSRTGADLTGQVLTQIILELETPKIASFPVSMLLRIIRTNDQFIREFVDRYFNQAFGAYLEYQRQVQEQLDQMRTTSSAFPDWSGAMFGAPATRGGASGKGGTGPEADPELQRTLADLQRQVGELRQELKKRRRTGRR